MAASRGGFLAVVKKLLRAKASVNLQDEVCRITAVDLEFRKEGFNEVNVEWCLVALGRFLVHSFHVS